MCAPQKLIHKPQSELAECNLSDLMMDVHTSQINCQRSMFLQEYKHSYSCVCVSQSCSHKFTQLGNYILQMAASRGERAKVTGGKYYCSTDLCLKVL